MTFLNIFKVIQLYERAMFVAVVEDTSVAEIIKKDGAVAVADIIRLEADKDTINNRVQITV